MPKVFNVCTNLVNGAGLEQDWKLVRHLLEGAGHKVNGCQFNNYQVAKPLADVCICLEVVNQNYFANENWLVPNSEWWFPGFNGTLKYFSKVLCKTQDTLRIWSKKVGAAKCVYTGFESNDLWQPWIDRKPTFLHAAGRSETKNTDAVIKAWIDYKLPYPLTVLTKRQDWLRAASRVPNVIISERVDEAVLRYMMNENLFHLMPSGYEGYGHSIHEALGCGGIVITTNAAPMNTFGGVEPSLLVPVTRVAPKLEAVFNTVSPQGIAEAVERAVALPFESLQQISDNARVAFHRERNEFRTRFLELANA